jgi:hypothetical protein
MRLFPGGAASADSGFQSIVKGTSHSFVDIAGHGALRYMAVFISAVNDSHKIWPMISSDGVKIQPHGLIDAMSARGFDATTLPLAITLYAADGDICLYYTFIPELTFDKTLKIEAENWSTVNNVNVSCAWTYYLL